MIKIKDLGLKKAKFTRTCRIMRLTILFIVFSISVCYSNNSYSQSTRISLNLRDKTVKQVLSEIEKKSEFVVFYQDDILDVNRKVTINAENETVEHILNEILSPTANTYFVSDRQIYVIKKETNTAGKGTQQTKSRRITGIIKDAKGDPQIGVTILVKGTNKGTSTDLNGNYVLDVEQGAVLVVSYVGFIKQEIAVKNETEINITLLEDTSELNEVTIVGYGVQKKISVVGSQQTIKAEAVKLPVRNLSASLAGRISGLVSVQRSGEPGADDANIYIRGISTLTAGQSQPLTLVDGVPRAFSDVDPEDIESFSILKDASATAVYGVRGANGVILITTKSGKIGKPKFNVRYTEGITRFTKKPEFVDGVKYLNLSNEAVRTRAVRANQSPYYPDEAIEATRNGTDPYLYPNINWIDELFKDFGHTRNVNANISGGSANATYYVGLGYYDESGLYKTETLDDYNANASYKRYNVTSNLTLKPTQTTEIKLGIQGWLGNANYPGANASTIFSSAFSAPPNYLPKKYPNGELANRPGGAINNPYVYLNHTGYSTQWRNQLFSNLRITQELPFVTSGLSVSAMFSFDTYNYTSNAFTKEPTTYFATNRDPYTEELILAPTRIGKDYLSYTNSASGERTFYFEASANYAKRIGRNDITAMVLYNQSDRINTKAVNVEAALPYRYRGIAGRTTYSYDTKYMVEFNFGYNGSENFHPDKRFGFFPAVGLGWVISGESFFEPLSEAVQFLKLRGTYGKVGNDNIGGDRRFAYISTVNSSDNSYNFGKGQNVNYSGLSVGEYAVNVTWETSTKLNLGVDITTLDNKLNIQIDWFKEKRENIFLRRDDMPLYAGIVVAPYGNIGKVDNKGFEISANYNNQWNDWSLSLLANFSFNRNEVVEDNSPWPYPWNERRGKKVAQRFGLVALGLFETEEEIAMSPGQSGDTRPGDIKYKDINGDGVINDNDYVPIGWGSVPEIMYGFGFTVGYKNLSIGALFQGVGNVDAMLSGEGMMPFSNGLTSGNIFTDIDSRWTEDNPRQDVKYPRLMPANSNMNYEPSTWWLRKSHYLRLKNLQIAYSIPKKLTRKVHLDGANIFFQGVNLLTFSPFKLWDVELGDGRGATYPNISTYSLGINFSF